MYQHLKELAEQFIADWPNIDEERAMLSEVSQKSEAGDLYVKAKVLDALFAAYCHGVRDCIRDIDPHDGARYINVMSMKLLRDGGGL